MSDLISTQEAVAKIVDTAIRKISSGEQKLTKEYEQSVIEAVNEILNIARRTEQPEIVRCKDCKHFEREMLYCDDLGFMCREDDFCSRAERRIDDKTNKGSSC